MTPKTASRTTKLIYQALYYLLIVIILVIFTFPLYWIVITSFKSPGDATVSPPAFIPFVQFQPTLSNYNDVLIGTKATTSSDEVTPSLFPRALLNTFNIGGIATILAVFLGTLSAYGFSRFKVYGEKNLMFFIMSTRMLPPVVVVIPIFIMFSSLGLRNSFIGLLLMYVTMGLPFVVWMMKGFFDKIPKEYEEAAMIDGCSRTEALYKVILPQSIPAILATTVFVLIIVWNEFLFSQLLNPNKFNTVPPYLNSLIGFGREWSRTAAAAVLFALPIVIFTVFVRHHLISGLTFGAVKD